MASNKMIDQRFMDLHSFVMRQTNQSQIILKKLDQLGDKVNYFLKKEQERRPSVNQDAR